MVITKPKTKMKAVNNNNAITIPVKFPEIIQLILENEFPMLKNNSMLYNLVLDKLSKDANTVQNMENVLSCIKDNCIKDVKGMYLKNREVRVKCSM